MSLTLIYIVGRPLKYVSLRLDPFLWGNTQPFLYCAAWIIAENKTPSKWQIQEEKESGRIGHNQPKFLLHQCKVMPIYYYCYLTMPLDGTYSENMMLPSKTLKICLSGDHSRKKSWGLGHMSSGPRPYRSQESDFHPCESSTNPS